MTPQKEIGCHIFKMAIISKFFLDLMDHIIRKYAGKKMKYFLNVSRFTINNCEYTFVTFYGNQSLGIFHETNSLKAMRWWNFINVKVWHNLCIHLFHRFAFECKIQNLNNRMLSVGRNVHGYDMNHTLLKSRIYVHTRWFKKSQHTPT